MSTSTSQILFTDAQRLRKLVIEEHSNDETLRVLLNLLVEKLIPHKVQGNWIDAFGKSCSYILPGKDGSSDLINLPNGITFTIDHANRYQWSINTESRYALQTPDATSRKATCFNTTTRPKKIESISTRHCWLPICGLTGTSSAFSDMDHGTGAKLTGNTRPLTKWWGFMV